MSQPARKFETEIGDATDWLSTRHVGASVAEYIQKLPPRTAEVFLKEIDDLKRMSFEITQADERVQRLVSNGTLVGIVSAITTFTFSSLWLSEWLAITATGVVVGMFWWTISRIKHHLWARKAEVWRERAAIEERFRKTYGIVYSEADQRLRAVAALEAQHARLEESLRINDVALAEIKRGADLATEANVDPALVRRIRNQPTVLGGLPTQELLEEADVETLFYEMSNSGLKEHTIEAVLLRYADGLAVNRKTLEIASTRFQKS